MFEMMHSVYTRAKGFVQLNNGNFTSSTQCRHKRHTYAINKARTINSIRHSGKHLQLNAKFNFKYKRWKCNYFIISFALLWYIALKTCQMFLHAYISQLICKVIWSMCVYLLNIRFPILRFESSDIQITLIIQVLTGVAFILI